MLAKHTVAIGNCSLAHQESIVIGDEMVSEHEGDVRIGYSLFRESIPDEVRNAMLVHPQAFAWFALRLGSFVMKECQK